MGKRNTHYKNENQEKTDNIMNADDSIFFVQDQLLKTKEQIRKGNFLNEKVDPKQYYGQLMDLLLKERVLM